MEFFTLNCMIRLVLTLSLVIGTRCQRRPVNVDIQTSCGNGSSLVNLRRYGGSCLYIFQNWYQYTVDPSYFGSQVEGGFENVIDERLGYENTTKWWGDICRWSHSLGICVRNVLPHCDDDIGTELLDNPLTGLFLLYGRGYDTLLSFHRRTCQGATIKPGIKTLLDDDEFDKNITCLNSSHHFDLRRCRSFLQEELREGSIFQVTGWWRQSFNRLAAGTLSCMYSLIRSSPCNDVTKKVMYQVARLQLPSFINIDDLNVTETTTSDFTSLLRCTVGVYGDPHLRLCWQPQLVTCSAVGEQTYLSNDFFSITAENRAIGTRNNPPATSVRQIQVTFKAISDSSIVGTYSGADGNLPEVFDNTNSSTIGQGDNKVTLRRYGYNRRQLIQHSTGMVLTLRQWSGNYFFTLRAAEHLIQSSSGLLATGCPTSQIIGLGRFVGPNRPQRRKRQAPVTETQCAVACNETTDLPEFRESCLFDCYVTQNLTFAVNMTQEANEDVIEIITKDEELRADALPPSTTTAPIATAARTTPKTSSATIQSPLGFFLAASMVVTGNFFRSI